MMSELNLHEMEMVSGGNSANPNSASTGDRHIVKPPFPPSHAPGGITGDRYIPFPRPTFKAQPNPDGI